MKIKKNKNYLQWHLIIIVTLLLVYSVFCWINYAKNLTGKVMYRISPPKEDSIIASNNVTNNTFETEDKKVNEIDIEKEQKENILLTFTKKIDKILNRADFLWREELYNKTNLSKIDLNYTFYTTGEIMSKYVLRGKDDWLFYYPNIADYEGTNEFTLLEMEQMLATSLYVQEEMDKRNIKFTILIPTNKEPIYSEFMPEKYEKAVMSRTDQLVDFLLKGGVNIVSTKDEMLKICHNYELYYTNDTHWNQLGGYIGVKTALDSLGFSIPNLSERTIISKKLSQYYHSSADGNLARMVGLRSIFDGGYEYEVKGTMPIDWTIIDRDFNDKKISYLHNPDAAVNKILFIIGDSYRTSMLPALSEQFEHVYAIHRDHYNSEMLDIVNPNYVIAEYLEFFSGRIGDMDSIVEPMF